jgi:hypothetical protein
MYDGNTKVWGLEPDGTPVPTNTATAVPPTSTAGPSPTPSHTPVPPTPTNTAVPGASSCQVDYTIANQWGTGVQVDVLVTNTSNTAINGYTLTWTFDGNESLDSGWNATFSSAGKSVAVSNPANNWNGMLAANGGTSSFGFQASHNGDVRIPDDFVLNGVTCNDIGGTPQPTVTAVPPTATNVPPTATTQPPTVTSVPPTATNVPPTATTIPPTATVPPTGATCSVAYIIANQWNSGFQTNITITNNGTTAIQGYNLVWNYAAGQTVSSGWNANFSQTGTTVTAANVASYWNGTIQPGGSVSFGFQGSHSGSNPAPTTFTLNGTTCSN